MCFQNNLNFFRRHNSNSVWYPYNLRTYLILFFSLSVIYLSNIINVLCCIVGTGVVNTFLRAANYRIHGNNLCMRQRRRLGRYYTVVAFFCCFVLVRYCKNRKKSQERNRASSSRSVLASHAYHFCIPPPPVQPISYYDINNLL